MKNFNQMSDDYSVSQSNLQAAQQINQPAYQNQQLQARQSTGSQRQLIPDEMSQDLQYLSREAPLDGGESTFGAATSYSQLHNHDEGSLIHMGSEMPDERLASPPPIDQLAADNVELARKPMQQAGFLVSFMVDARGGAMCGCRHSGVRVIIPPNSAQMPMRITCRYLRRERLVHPPPLMDGEACASKIMEVGPAGAKFLGPVLIEVPHFASLRNNEREIIILRSDTGEIWREHMVEVDERLVDSIIASARESSQPRAGDNQENQAPASDLEDSVAFDTANSKQDSRQLTRILTTEFPQYFAIISRIKQEVHAVGPQGTNVQSQLESRVEAVFPPGALKKRIKIGLQTQSVPDELVMKLYGSLKSISFSPIVTIEPRRRKFHRTIEMRMPLPASYTPQSEENLRLLCSIEEGRNRAEWKDMTESIKPLAIDRRTNCLLFPTTISARYWLVHALAGPIEAGGSLARAPAAKGSLASQLRAQASELYLNLIRVPFMAKFVIFAKRRDINEANIRVFCMTDDKEERTLEVQEHYSQVAKSRDVEVLEGQNMYLEFGGNLQPIGASGRHPRQSSALINEQLFFNFRSFQENRLAFAVRVQELGQEASGRIAFVEDSLKYLASLNRQQREYLQLRSRRAICTLGLQLPAMCVNQDSILGTPKRNSHLAGARIGDLSLADVAELLDLEADGRQTRSPLEGDWLQLAPRLGIPRDEVEFIAGYWYQQQAQGRRLATSPALMLLMHWHRLSSADERDQDLARALVAIGRHDIAQQLNFPVEPKKMSRSTMELLREIELIPVRSTESLLSAQGRATSSELGLARGPKTRSSSRSALEDDDRRRQALRQRSESNVEESFGRDGEFPMETRVSTREWTETKDGTLSHKLEQTAYFDSSPRKEKSRRKKN